MVTTTFAKDRKKKCTESKTKRDCGKVRKVKRYKKATATEYKWKVSESE